MTLGLITPVTPRIRLDRRFVVNAGSGSNPIDDRATAIGVRELPAVLAAFAA